MNYKQLKYITMKDLIEFINPNLYWKVFSAVVVFYIIAYITSGLLGITTFQSLFIVSAVALLYLILNIIGVKQAQNAVNENLELKEALEYYQKNEQGYTAHIQTLEDNFKTLKTESDALKNRFGTLQNESMDRAKRLSELQTIEERFKNVHENRELLHKQFRTLDEKHETLKSDYQDLYEAFGDVQKKYKSTAAQLSQAKGKLNKLL